MRVQSSQSNLVLRHSREAPTRHLARHRQPVCARVECGQPLWFAPEPVRGVSL